MNAHQGDGSGSGSRIRVAIGASSFAQSDPTPLRLLERAGIEVLPNPFGRRLTELEVREHLASADGLLAGLEPLTAAVFDGAPRLRAIARVGIGMSNVDSEAAGARGIKVSNTPDAPTEAVAELTITALLCLARRIVDVNDALHQKRWEKRIGRGVRGSTALVIGMGRIGRRVAELLRVLGADVLAYDPHVDIDPSVATPMELAEALERTDFVLVHAGGEQLIIGEKELQRLKSGAYLLNAGRGGLVDEDALVRALDSGRIAGAWLDVFSEEPYKGPLTERRGAILTPHVGTYTEQCRLQMESDAVRNLIRDLGLE